MIGFAAGVLLLVSPSPLGGAESHGVKIVAGPEPAHPPLMDPDPPDVPDLGPIRYRDPMVARRLWLGLEVGGVAIPRNIGLFPRSVWAQRTSGSWALALSPWLAVGGRHDLVWYDARNIRLQVNEHRLSFSGRPLHGRHSEVLRDRLSAGVELHMVKRFWTAQVGETVSFDSAKFKPGGLWDVIVFLGYGFDHRLHEKVSVGWTVQGRYLWVFNDTQRQVRATVRPTIYLRPNHALSAEGVLYYINRNERQGGNLLPQNSVAGQVNLEYTWMSRRNVGVFARVHYATSFMSGDAPIYEMREEAINTHYGEGSLGLRAIW